MEQKLNFLTKELIDKAVSQIDKKNIPAGRKGTKYAVKINGKQYPFKLIITEAALLAGVDLTPKDFSSNAHYRQYLTELSGYQVVNLKHNKAFFNLPQLHKYHLEARKPYDANSIGASTYYDTREKLQYLGHQLGESLSLKVTNNYNEQPNKMAGRGKGFILKEYILTGFAPTKFVEIASDFFIKISFHNSLSQLFFGIEIDVNFSKKNNEYNIYRDKFINDSSWRIPVDKTFPDNWNDLINLTQAIFKRLATYIEDFFLNNLEMDNLNEYIKILKHKKQIILQGPPGTGKTYTAKKIAKLMTGCRIISTYDTLTTDTIKSSFSIGQKIDNASGKEDYYTINTIGEDHIELQSDRSQPWKPKFTKIISKYNELVSGSKPNNTHALDPYELAVAIYLFKNTLPSKTKTEHNFTIVQFHPSYSYEDFVRGISVKNMDDNIVYKTENKIVAQLSKLASKKNDLEGFNLTEEYRNYLKENAEESKRNDRHYFFNKEKTIRLLDIHSSSGNLRFETKKHTGNWVMQTWIDLEEKYDLKSWQNPDSHKLNNFDNPDHYAIWQDFDAYVKKLKNNDYVLIIDEINRANLPSVLGELIYALEYRGESVNSMYAINGDANITIPENLYIIGTMNTADRSVGHIDYAIKRRFAFVDMLPNADVISYEKAKDLFTKVCKLFTPKYLAPDFEAKDVHLGHSYFLLDEKSELDDSEQLQLKLHYEITPLLNEYLKDGLLLETAKELIKEISEFDC